MGGLEVDDELALTGNLVASLGDRVRRAFPDVEVEIKFSLANGESAKEVLARLVPVWQDSKEFVVDYVRDGESSMRPRYVIVDGVEHSEFIYAGQPVVKMKKHEVVYSGDIPVMVSSEVFHEGDAAIYWIQENQESLAYELDKHRAKVFLLSRRTGDVYSAAITVCKIDNEQQTQLEVEYFGSAGDLPSDVETIVQMVASTGMAIADLSDGAHVTTETKYEFVSRVVDSKEKEKEK